MSKSILIIEDDQSIADLEKDFLEIDGFNVEIATNGELGLELALSQCFDLVLLDLMIPVIDGFQLCKCVRKETDIPILIVSAKYDDNDKVRGFGLGADDYIVKPFSPTELVARIKAHLAKYDHFINKNTPKGEIALGDLRIQPLSRKVFLRDNEIELTNKEFDLLIFLASHPNHVFSKEELFERIWGFDAMGDNATVTVHIKRIRKKVKDQSANHQYI
ncbi:response regulator transcription factor [Mammaliicoccus sciuri]|uniref:response regulator transcription factor n=1 Tax=Mammaliicoccus sciuri TaxID=1296 RepID=UPI000CD17214|nr:response regulator transcription factor [Mammaliicoccus sciuri]MDT0696864.1 response regulator transcription factor [Mammaliicoccus sciuri]PNZ25657.1 DNA-binding response regulator [Mammaliicoccus sciuri]